ncbi:MAG: hypothetical protein ACXVFN_02855 [Solirubrobacteraceae bacterium]
MVVTHLPFSDERRRVRLEDRAHRLGTVLSELRRRARSHPRPDLIGQAIYGFDRELAAVRRELRAARGGR